MFVQVHNVNMIEIRERKCHVKQTNYRAIVNADAFLRRQVARLLCCNPAKRDALRDLNQPTCYDI